MVEVEGNSTGVGYIQVGPVVREVHIHMLDSYLVRNLCVLANIELSSVARRIKPGWQYVIHCSFVCSVAQF